MVMPMRQCRDRPRGLRKAGIGGRARTRMPGRQALGLRVITWGGGQVLMIGG